jgi:hypothetical protein
MGRRRRGLKYSKKELENKERGAVEREPLLIMREDKRPTHPEDRPENRLSTTAIAEAVMQKEDGMSKHKTGPHGMRRAGRDNPMTRKKSNVEAAWVSPESHDLDKLMSGEEKLDYSKGRWVFPKKADEPNLIDVLLRNDYTDRYMATPPRLKLLQAQRFMLDSMASEFFGHVTMDFGDQVLAQHEMARAPYELCWIEYDSLAYAAIVASTRGPEEDTKVGYLYDHGFIWTASMGSTPKSASFLPYRVRLNTPVSQEEELRMAQFFHFDVPTYRAYVMGRYGPRKEEMTQREYLMGPEVTAIVRSHMFEFDPGFMAMLEKSDVSVVAKQKMLASCAGMMKQALIMLIILTRPNKHVYFSDEPRPARRVWLGARQVAAVAYNKVTVHLEQKDALRRMSEHITGAHRKEHDVREHWCQSRKKGAGCTHKFVLTDPKHGECVHGCGAKIWWKKPHKRGDIRLGTVSKVYEVTQ